MGSNVKGTRFIALATHRRLRLLCQGLDAASSLLVDGSLTGSSEESDQAFSELRRGALDALRLKDEEGAYEAHFIKMTQEMHTDDIIVLWKYLIEYVRKRGRPLSKRPILEAVAAFLELADGTSWGPALEKLLPTAPLSQEYLDAFHANVAISPVRESSLAAQSSRVKTMTSDLVDRRESASPKLKMHQDIQDITKRFAEKKAIRQAAQTRPQPSESAKVVAGASENGRPRLSVNGPKAKKVSSAENWWDTPPPEHLQPAVSGLSANDCWWDGVDDDTNDNPSQGLPSPPVYFQQQNGRSAPAPSVFSGLRSVSSPQLQQLGPNGLQIPAHMQPHTTTSCSALGPSQGFNAGNAPPFTMGQTAASSSLFSPERGLEATFPSTRVDAFADLNGWIDAPAFSTDVGEELEKKKKKKKKKSRIGDSDGDVPKLPGPKAHGKPRFTTVTAESGDLWFDSREQSPFATFQG